MSYKVINKFQEKEHDGHIYEAGDTYPAEGYKLVNSRAEFLTKEHAEYGVAFLVKNTEKSTKNSPKLTGNQEKSDAE